MEPVFPMRINKYLAQKGISTRVGADTLIRDGLVRINGKKAVLGARVLENDKVLVLQNEQNLKNYFYALYYKPRGVVTHSPKKGEPSIEGTGNLVSSIGARLVFTPVSLSVTSRNENLADL